jgi:hypothetical protein
MGRARSCDKRCHNAKQKRCSCWCGSRFHGSVAAARAAREEFLEKHGVLAKTELEYEELVDQQTLPGCSRQEIARCDR